MAKNVCPTRARWDSSALPRSDKEFGFHKMTYVIQNNQITSMEKDHDTNSGKTASDFE